jgi:hypothetical protein
VSAQIRTVRLLSREPGEPTETRMVEGVVIEKGIEHKPFHNGLIRILAALEPGESFVWPSSPSFSRKRLRPREFASKRIKGSSRYRVWRVK